MSIGERIAEMKAEMQKTQIDPAKGLGTELFMFASTLMPVVNVDLLVTNIQGEILLSWRDDPHCGKGWHVPGGCIRLNETFETRIQKTALAELGAKVWFNPAPIGVYEIFSSEHRAGIADQRERAHFITLAFHCRLAEDYQIKPERTVPDKVGSLRWFPDLPDNLLTAQQCYRDHWNEIRERLGGINNGCLEERTGSSRAD